MTIAQFIWVLRQRLQLGKNKAIYLFVNKTLPQSSALVGEVYNQHHDEDGFVYCKFQFIFDLKVLINIKDFFELLLDKSQMSINNLN